MLICTPTGLCWFNFVFFQHPSVNEERKRSTKRKQVFSKIHLVAFQENKAKHIYHHNYVRGGSYANVRFLLILTDVLASQHLSLQSPQYAPK